VLDEAIELYPEVAMAVIGRGVLLARSGDRTKAHADAKRALALDHAASVEYQAACIYALTSPTMADDAGQAIRHLATALGQGFGRDLVASDGDLDPIRSDPEFIRLVGDQAIVAQQRGGP
jgi:hypothetical protein